MLGQAERRALDPTEAATPRQRSRLYLKDGSYQSVLSYRVLKDRVRYRSAERDGEEEEIPLALVDLAATQRWEAAREADSASGQQSSPVLSPELAREEAERAARSPEVAPDLHLPEENSVLAMDTFQGIAELVPLPQSGTELNRETAHAVVKKEINPASTPHDLLLLKDERADVQLHVPDPAFFVRLQGAAQAVEDAGGGSFVVDTHGQAGRGTPDGALPQSTYVLEHVDVRQGARAVESLRLPLSSKERAQPDVIALRAQDLPGGFWRKLVPEQPLEFGEYVLLEVLSDRMVNSSVWDFGVHPTAKENDEALRPEPKRPKSLERRPR